MTVAAALALRYNPPGILNRARCVLAALFARLAAKLLPQREQLVVPRYVVLYVLQLLLEEERKPPFTVTDTRMAFPLIHRDPLPMTREVWPVDRVNACDVGQAVRVDVIEVMRERNPESERARALMNAIAQVESGFACPALLANDVLAHLLNNPDAVAAAHTSPWPVEDDFMKRLRFIIAQTGASPGLEALLDFIEEGRDP